MPTYTYRCASCGHTFEEFQRMTDDALTECPECTGPISRVIYPVGVVFKGSGWYITDSRESRNGKKPADGASDTGEKAKTGGKGEEAPAAKQSSDGKPEATPKKSEAKSAAD
ncbi:MAG: zinc ribbon domain-containing protein [Chloroflexota bacterium]|nr:zinc ribbon domain-containing protein [Chloroflexota bacterium]